MAEAERPDEDEKEMTFSSVDLLFLLDCTGSMGPYLTATKEKIRDTVARIIEKSPGTCINLGFVGYRDHGDSAIEPYRFNPNVEQFQAFVAGLEAKGGDDWPEDMLGGLWTSANLEWASDTRVIFHIFDAPPHGYGVFHQHPGDLYPEGHPSDKPLSEIFGKFKEKNIDYYMMVQGKHDLPRMVSKFEEEAKEIEYMHIEKRERIDDCELIMQDVAVAVLSSMSLLPSTIPRPADRSDPILQLHTVRNNYQVYCGIDFGTHGTAFAFCTPGDPVVRAVNSWSGGCVDVKTKTNLLLGPNKKRVLGPDAFGDAAFDRYVNEMDEDEQQDHYFFRWFKMALYKNAIPAENRGDKVDIEGYIRDDKGKRVRSRTVLIEALKFIIDHVMGQIWSQYEISDKSKVQWILTVPAIWSHRSRNIMERAAYDAGIPRGNSDQLLIALEPECAAVIAQEMLSLKHDDCYILVDCGGGTVDIVCYQAVSGSAVKEIHSPTGGPWGSTYIDAAFLRYIKAALGEEVSAVIDDEPGLRENILHKFNLAKANVLPTDESRKVDLNMLKPLLKLRREERLAALNARLNDFQLEEKHFEGVVGGTQFNKRGQFIIQRNVWAALFSVVIDDIIDHIRGLLDANRFIGVDSSEIKTIFVVGGFASSPMLMERLQEAFQTTERRVVRPNNPILTVVRGAAKYGLIPTTIVEHVAPKTIGVAIRDDFIEGSDPEERKVSVGPANFIDGVFFPFVKAGQPIPGNMPPVVHRFEAVRPDYFVIQLYQSDEKNPRLVPDQPCATIGPEALPPDFNRNEHDIELQFAFHAWPMVKATVSFGGIAKEIDIEWQE